MTDPSSPSRRRRVASAVLAGICALGLVGFAVLVVVGVSSMIGDSRADEVVSRYAADEQHRDDVAWLVLRDAARAHLHAVRTSASAVPDDDLAQALVAYAGYGKRFWRKPQGDPTERLAAVRVAMDDLRPLDGPRIPCPETIHTGMPPQCAAYFGALAGLFGRSL